MRQTTLHIAQPCHESWDAMMPTTTGRHCAACAKTVVDFTLKTDAEILAYLAKAANGRTCGRFAAGQLERPLQRATPTAPTARWRAWLAAAVAVWALRETAGTTAQAQAPIEMRRMGESGAGPEQLRTLRKPDKEQAAPVQHIIRGVVSDRSTGEGLPGVTVLIKGTMAGSTTNANGVFEMMVPAEYTGSSGITLLVRTIGYATQERQVLLATVEQPLSFLLNTETMGQLGYSITPPAPWHPRSFYYWGKYWLTRPFSH